MEQQYFIPKHKDEYLPEIVNEMMLSGRIQRVYPWNNSILSIEKRFFRKLKIQNIENRLTGDNKKLLDVLIDEKFTHLLTPSEYKKRTTTQSSSGFSGTWGMSGTSGVSGVSGGYGVSGSNTITTGNYNTAIGHTVLAAGTYTTYTI